MSALAALLPAVVAIAERAGAAILQHYAEGAAATRKADGSPVTAADHAAEAIILAALAELDPGVPIVSEEEAAAGRAPVVGAPRFWCVDPLDGTKEFVGRTGEFTVCIAIVEDFRPVLGVLHAPALGLTVGGAEGRAWRYREGRAEPIAARRPPPAGPVALTSRSHRDGADLEARLAAEGVSEQRIMGSAAKFALIAAGEADLYVRYGPTSEWDTAAGQAVLEAAGGRLLTLDGGPFRYAKPGFRNPGFVARGRL